MSGSIDILPGREPVPEVFQNGPSTPFPVSHRRRPIAADKQHVVEVNAPGGQEYNQLLCYLSPRVSVLAIGVSELNISRLHVDADVLFHAGPGGAVV